MISSILKYFGYTRISNIRQQEDLFNEDSSNKDTVVAKISGIQQTRLVRDDCDDIVNKHPTGYICLEKPNGKRYYKYYGFTGDRNFSFDKETTSIFVNYIAPWLEGAETIPDEYLLTNNKKTRCLHCNEYFLTEQDELQFDFINCKKCGKTNINKFKFTEETIREYEIKICTKYLSLFRDNFNTFLEKKLLNKSEERVLGKLIGLINSKDADIL